MTKTEMIREALIRLVADPYYYFNQISTIEVQQEVKELYDVDVSERQVQRIRKQMSEDYDNAIYTQMSDHHKKGNDMNTRVFSPLEIGIINTINNSYDISLQFLAEKMKMEVDEVKNIIRKCREYIKKSVWDEEKSIYFDPESSEIFDIKDLPVGVTVTTLTETVSDDGSQMDDDYWEVELDCVKACSKVKQSVPVVVSSIVKKKVSLFMKWSGRREWLAYLVGKVNGDYEKVEVFDIYLPDQRASSTLVDKVVAENYNKLSVVGVIHSHHEMGSGHEDNPSFSGHDAAFINSNHNVSLLVGFDKNKKIKINGIVRLKTPCGSFIQVKANVKSMKENDPEEIELKKEFEEKINGRNSQF